MEHPTHPKGTFAEDRHSNKVQTSDRGSVGKAAQAATLDIFGSLADEVESVSTPIHPPMSPRPNGWFDTNDGAPMERPHTEPDDHQPDPSWPPSMEDELEFEAPTVLSKERLQVLLEAQFRVGPFSGRSFHFHGNYRRFLVFLFLGLLAWSPICYSALKSGGFARPIGPTLFFLTLGWGLACLIYTLGVYRRRGITVDEFGLFYHDELREFLVSWDELRSVHLHAVEAFFNPYPLCYVRVVTQTDQEFAFANFGNHLFGIQRKVSFGNPPYPIIDVRDADLLLALLVQQAKGLEQAPDLNRLRFRAHSEHEQQQDSPEALQQILHKPQENKPFYAGLWALFGKIGLKWMPQGLKVLFTSIKPAYAGVSIGLYALFFRWEFAVVLALILMIHELGHVWAMYRAGMSIKGVYLIPFFGAATVTEDIWPSWNTLAKVNLAGPLWGAYMTAFCLLMYWFFPTPFWLMAAVWGALLNLLNLLPIQPLDGGRILNAIAYSLQSAFGFVIAVLILAVCVVFSLSLEFILLYIFSLVGIAEFFREYMMRLRADKLSLLSNYRHMHVRELLLFKRITGINFGVRYATMLQEQEENTFKRLRMILHAPPMSRLQMLQIGLTTFGIALSLFAFLLIARHMTTHASVAIDIFR